MPYADPEARARYIRERRQRSPEYRQREREQQRDYYRRNREQRLAYFQGRRHRKREARCLECSNDRKGKGAARGLCAMCYDRAHANGRHLDYERQSYAIEELIAEWLWLRVEGYTRRQVAERLGITLNGLEKALLRARKRGLLTREQSLALPTLGKLVHAKLDIKD